MKSTKQQWEKLRDKDYREEFVATQLRRAVPLQIRALMRKKKISQQQLAERAGLTQGVISRAANPAYGRMTLNTIIRVAAGLDLAFIGVFVPFTKLVDYFNELTEDNVLEIPTFEEEDEEIQATGTGDMATADDLADLLAAVAEEQRQSQQRSEPPRQLELDYGKQAGVNSQPPPPSEQKGKELYDGQPDSDQRNEYARAA